MKEEAMKNWKRIETERIASVIFKEICICEKEVINSFDKLKKLFGDLK